MRMTDEEFKEKMAYYDRLDMISYTSIALSIISILITIFLKRPKKESISPQHASPAVR